MIDRQSPHISELKPLPSKKHNEIFSAKCFGQCSFFQEYDIYHYDLF